MATRASDVKTSSQHAGRSALTGRFVLMPASKAGSVTVKKARTAVKQVSKKK